MLYSSEICHNVEVRRWLATASRSHVIMQKNLVAVLYRVGRASGFQEYLLKFLVGIPDVADPLETRSFLIHVYVITLNLVVLCQTV